MAEDFTVEVPISFKGETGATGAGTGVKREMEKLNRNTLKLNKTMFLNIDVIEILSSLLGEVHRVLRPLFKLLSLMLLLIFMPLMPIYKDLVKALSKLAGVMGKITKAGGVGELDIGTLGKTIIVIIGGILIAAGVAILFAVGGWILVLLGSIAAIIIVFWENIGEFLTNAWNNYILPAFQWIGQQIIWVWEGILLPAWNFLKDVGLWIWERIIRPSWEFLRDVGSWIWDIISAPFRCLADKIRGIWDWFGDIGGRVGRWLGFQQGGVVPGPVGAPQLAVVHGGERIIPAGAGMGSVTININNPMVRQTSDIKALANEMSRVLQRQMSGRISAR